MKILETRPREIGFVLWDHCQNLLDDPRKQEFRLLDNEIDEVLSFFLF